ncbi:hypothetical protein DNTS_008194 [Danionella cerebrum]|uniref:snRNA-activating protein complex subunit 3 n=1 Tax=Danionella cerebrum TaxID=2873325 RepID=A0A553R5I6_9TELE|nr:hypothetical protein DNTS_008194 [Danionella translucida]
MADGGNENVPDFEFVDVNSKEFHIGTFRDLWLDALHPEMYAHSDTAPEIEDEKFIEEIGVDSKTLEELKSICSVDSLKSADEDVETVPADSHLATLQLRKRRQEYRETLFRGTLDRHELYNNEEQMAYMRKRPEDLKDLVPEGEIVLIFNVMYPAVFQRFKQMRAHQTMHVLGSQKLSDLRDAISCVSDLQVFGEFSDTPDIVPQFLSKDHYKSAFFYFNGTFFNDTRFPECQDISATIREWARGREFPDFKTATMEDTYFYDLKLKVGFPYLFTHQGDCEHVVILTDVRLVHQEDCLDVKLYPLITHKHKGFTRKCSVCHVYIGRWITTNDALAPSDPCLFCDQCFRIFHYDNQGKKLGDFQAYAYVDPATYN